MNKIKFPFGEKFKEGISVQELEEFAIRYTTEIFLILSLVIAFISASMFMFFSLGPKTAIFFTTLGTIFSIGMADSVNKIHKKFFAFISKKEKSSQILFGIIRILIALFLPFLLFAEIGLLAGSAFRWFFQQGLKEQMSSRKEEVSSEKEKEHL